MEAWKYYPSIPVSAILAVPIITAIKNHSLKVNLQKSLSPVSSTQRSKKLEPIAVNKHTKLYEIMSSIISKNNAKI